ncbi:MAG: hypothetical protein JO304_26050 [Solirubrobacterales bacterium]|nr:hypothetical protein [Solirubrobacterales bacterium]
MSSRLTRTLLKLYPRRIRDRYGDELLDLQDELRTRGDVSRLGLIRDMLAGSLLVRPARRAHLIIGAVLVIGGLALGGAAIRGPGTGPAAPASQARLKVKTINPVPYGSCFVGSSCSLTPCSEFTGQPSAEGAVAYRSPPATRSWPHLAATRCATYPRVRSYQPVFVGE